MDKDWPTIKQESQRTKSDLDSLTTPARIDDLMDRLNMSLKRFIVRAGVQTSGENGSDADYDSAVSLHRSLMKLQDDYTKLNHYLTYQVKDIMSNADVQTRLQRLGDIKQEIAKLRKQVDQTKQDADTAKSRQQSVEKTRQDISYYQGFSGWLRFSKPIKPISVPFLMAFGVILIFLSALILREFSSGDVSTHFLETGASFFSSKRFYALMAGILFSFLVTGILAYLGYFGTIV